MSPVPVAPSQDDRQPPRALVVEDDPLSLELLQESLLAREIEVRLISDSRLAALLIAQEKFDGIFLDLMIPEFDGFELIRQIRKTPLNKRVPIVVVSGREEQKTMQEAFAAGATFFLHKPLDRQKLNQLLNSTLGSVFLQRQRGGK